MQGLKTPYNYFENDYIPMRQYAPWSYMYNQDRGKREMSDKLHRTSGGIIGKHRRLGKLQQPIKLQKDQGGMYHE